MAQHTDDPGNHGCGIAWCVNTSDASKAQLLEHLMRDRYVAATGNSLSFNCKAFNQTVQTVGVGARFNADVDPSPRVYLHIFGGPHDADTDAELQVNEAILLHQALGDVLRDLLKGSELDSAAVREYYL